MLDCIEMNLVRTVTVVQVTSCVQLLEHEYRALSVWSLGRAYLEELIDFIICCPFFDRYIHIIIIHDSLVTELVFQLYISISVLHFFATIF